MKNRNFNMLVFGAGMLSMAGNVYSYGPSSEEDYTPGVTTKYETYLGQNSYDVRQTREPSARAQRNPSAKGTNVHRFPQKGTRSDNTNRENAGNMPQDHRSDRQDRRSDRQDRRSDRQDRRSDRQGYGFDRQGNRFDGKRWGRWFRGDDRRGRYWFNSYRNRFFTSDFYWPRVTVFNTFFTDIVPGLQSYGLPPSVYQQLMAQIQQLQAMLAQQSQDAALNEATKQQLVTVLGSLVDNIPGLDVEDLFQRSGPQGFGQR